MSIYNLDGVKKAEQLGFSRVVLAREVPISEIKSICESSSIEIGDYFASDIDIDDVSALGTSTCITSASALTHELVEQFEKQSKGLPNDWSGCPTQLQNLRYESNIEPVDENDIEDFDSKPLNNYIG